MANYRKILCPVDFSPFSAVALKEAAQIAKIFNSKLVVAHIITNPWSEQYQAGSSKPITPKELNASVRKKVKAFADLYIPDISFEMVVRIHEHTYKGLIEYASLVEYASNELVDLIVLSTHGYSGTPKQFIGSVAESVIRQAPCSVLVVRDSEDLSFQDS